MYSRIKQLNRFTDMIQIRPSQLSDLDRLMEIFDHARKFMASVGNGNQWINGYPQRELIAKEITDGHCYACEDEHRFRRKLQRHWRYLFKLVHQAISKLTCGHT